MTKRDFSDAFEKLKSEGFRLTGVRKTLVEAILRTEGHWTIHDLDVKLKKKIPTVGIATLYRTVQLLTKLRILSETRVGSGAARYEVSTLEHHDHLTCRQCGEVFEFENEEIERLQSVMAKRLGFGLVDHTMELYGDCQRKNCSNLLLSQRGPRPRKND